MLSQWALCEVFDVLCTLTTRFKEDELLSYVVCVTAAPPSAIFHLVSRSADTALIVQAWLQVSQLEFYVCYSTVTVQDTVSAEMGLLLVAVVVEEGEVEKGQ